MSELQGQGPNDKKVITGCLMYAPPNQIARGALFTIAHTENPHVTCFRREFDAKCGSSARCPPPNEKVCEHVCVHIALAVFEQQAKTRKHENTLCACF